MTPSTGRYAPIPSLAASFAIVVDVRSGSAGGCHPARRACTDNMLSGTSMPPGVNHDARRDDRRRRAGMAGPARAPLPPGHHDADGNLRYKGTPPNGDAVHAWLVPRRVRPRHPFAHIDIAGTRPDAGRPLWHTVGCSRFGGRLLVLLSTISLGPDSPIKLLASRPDRSTRFTVTSSTRAPAGGAVVGMVDAGGLRGGPRPGRARRCHRRRTVVLDARHVHVGPRRAGRRTSASTPRCWRTRSSPRLKDHLLGEPGRPGPAGAQARRPGVNVAALDGAAVDAARFAADAIGAGLAYVRGDSPRLNADVVVDDVAGRVRAGDGPPRPARSSRRRRPDGRVARRRHRVPCATSPTSSPPAGCRRRSPRSVGRRSTRSTSSTRSSTGSATTRRPRRAAGGDRVAGWSTTSATPIIDGVASAAAGHAAEAAEWPRRRADDRRHRPGRRARRRPVVDVAATFDAARDLARSSDPWSASRPPAVVGLGLVCCSGEHPLGRRPALLAGPVAGRRWTAAVALVVRGRFARRFAAGTAPAPGVPPGEGSPAPATLPRRSATGSGRQVWRYAGVAVRSPGAMRRRRNVAVPRAVTWRGGPSPGAGRGRRDSRSSPVSSGPPGTPARALQRARGAVRPPLRRGRRTAATHNSMSSPDVVQVWPEHDGDLPRSSTPGCGRCSSTPTTGRRSRRPEQLAARSTPSQPPARRRSPRLVRHARPAARRPRRARSCATTTACSAGCLRGRAGEVRAFLDANPDEVVTLSSRTPSRPDDTGAASTPPASSPTSFTQTPRAVADAGRADRPRASASSSSPRRSGRRRPGTPTPSRRCRRRRSCSSRPTSSRARPTGRPRTPAVPDEPLGPAHRARPGRRGEVNRFDVLVDRARQCQAERGRLPNFLAVNFYNIGDLAGAADVLNGVAG